MDNRLVYRVVLKLLFLVALGVLTIVFINSLFIGSDKERKTQSAVAKSIVLLDLSNMKKGDVKTIHWDGKEVAVLHRKTNFPFYHTKYIAKIPHQSVNSGLRSLKTEYFVYFNYGDSNNCPLFVEDYGLKDVCTGTKFNTSGRVKGNEQQGYRLKIPPHHFEGVILTIGDWETDK